MTDLLEQLNPSQREAVVYCDGPQLVIAGAGSGKTRVLTYKIAYLLQTGQMAPWNILALTFTNKAAGEMKERIARLVGEERARYLQMGTFHSVFAHMLRVEAQTIDYQSNFTIYDQADSRSLVKNIVKEMGLDDKQYKPNSVADQISMAKNHLIQPEAFVHCSLFDPKHPKVYDIYCRYAERCRQANVMDFDDLLLQTFLLFSQHDDIRRKYAEKYRYVLVDEYQDTNVAQQRIVYQLTSEHQHVCVVGDDAQSIYSFRGANIDNILHFRECYDGARLFKLEQNYRSTQLIVEAANSLIRKNVQQIPKDVFSENEHGEKLQMKYAFSDREEAIIVCRDILSLRRKEHCPWSHFAILYRTNSQSRSFEEQMRKDNIPYRIYGGLSFYQRKEIKDVIAYFRTVSNPDDEEALRRIINYPTRGIGDTTVAKIVQTATQHGVSLWTVISQPVLFRLDVSKSTAAKLEAFRQLIEDWRTCMNTQDAYQLGHDIITQSGISKEIYSSNNPDDLSRQENLEEFLSSLNDFVDTRREEDMADQVSLPHFLQEVALITDLDSDNDTTQERVSLMTIHAAKGLEFPTVFIVGLEENIFPSPLCTGSMRALEEERRLLYVAITRAERHCILTSAQHRFRYGRMEDDSPSRFIRDIDPQLLNEQGGDKTTATMQPRPHLRPQINQSVNTIPAGFKSLIHTVTPSVAPSSASNGAAGVGSAQGGELREGMTIEHQRFGIGTVVRLEGTGENQKATVDFRNAGTKQLLLKFAKFKVV